MIKDIGEDSSGTFLKIWEPTLMQSGSVICIGEITIVVGIIFSKIIVKSNEDK